MALAINQLWPNEARRLAGAIASASCSLQARKHLYGSVRTAGPARVRPCVIAGQPHACVARWSVCPCSHRSTTHLKVIICNPASVIESCANHSGAAARMSVRLVVAILVAASLRCATAQQTELQSWLSPGECASFPVQLGEGERHYQLLLAAEAGSLRHGSHTCFAALFDLGSMARRGSLVVMYLAKYLSHHCLIWPAATQLQVSDLAESST